jgi:hypothetical protein
LLSPRRRCSSPGSSSVDFDAGAEAKTGLEEGAGNARWVLWMLWIGAWVGTGGFEGGGGGRGGWKVVGGGMEEEEEEEEEESGDVGVLNGNLDLDPRIVALMLLVLSFKWMRGGAGMLL